MTLGEVIETEIIKDIIKKLVRNENISNPDISFESGSKVGQGYGSVNTVVNIKNDEKSLSVFIKISPKNPNLRKVTGSRYHFLREIQIYQRVLPVLSNICEQANTHFNIAPKCYDISSEDCKEYLVLDNLRKNGFMLKPNGILFEEDHALLVLQKLADFHAASYVLKDQNIKLFQELTGNIPSLWYDLFERHNHFDNIRHFANLIKGYLDPIKDRNIIEIIDNLPEKFAQMMLHMDKNIDSYCVLLHADVWTNNIMFCYNEQNNPVDIRLVDFQMSMLNTPVLDLAQFFYTCCFSKELMDNLDYYLDYYYGCLSKNIAMMGSDPDIAYPHTIFKQQWKEKCRFGLYMAFGIFKLVLGGENGGAQIVDAIKNTDKPTSNVFMLNIIQEKEYAEILIRILRHMVEKNYDM